MITAYSRKFYLLENCIYGVDIQPMAIEIVKYRLFLSLITDEVHALPDVETRFFYVDTLLGMTTSGRRDLEQRGVTCQH